VRQGGDLQGRGKMTYWVSKDWKTLIPYREEEEEKSWWEQLFPPGDVGVSARMTATTPYPIQPLGEEEQLREKARQAGESHYWSEAEKAWKLVEAPEEVPFSRMPFAQQIDPLGEVAPFKQIGEAMTSPEAETTKDILSLIGLVGTLGVGGYQVVRASWLAFLRASLTRAFQSRAAERGVQISRAEAELLARQVVHGEFRAIQKAAPGVTIERSTRFRKTWLTKEALRQMFRLTKDGYKMPDPTKAQIAARDASDVADDIIGALIPRGTQTGAMAMGGKPSPKPFSELTQLPVGITKVPEVLTPLEGGVAYLPPTLDVATNAQKVYAHKIAERKHFTEKARRKLAKLYTGKRSMLDMTEEEAQTFIEVLEALPKARYEIRAGKKVFVAPTIPRTKAVVPENFFNLKFKEPTPIRFFTSQEYYTQVLGIKPLVRPLELAKQRFDLEHQAFANAVEMKIESLNKIAGTSTAEKIASKVKNVPTKAERAMRDLLNEFEDPPAFLSAEEREIFTWFRNLNKTMLSGQNEVRALLGIDPIPYRRAYVRHIAEGMALEMLQGIHPFPEGLKYWSERLVGKKVFNPMEYQRQVADDLEQYFTRDLAFATKSMLWTGLKEIHLSRPLLAFTEQLTAFTKDLPAYENLSVEEIARVRKMSVMPASTRKWLENYVNQVIKGQPTGLDMEINRIFMGEGMRGVVNKMLVPFGRSVGRLPLTKLGQILGRTIMAAVLGPLRVKLIIRNKHQLMQNLALYTLRANIKGVLMPSTVQMEEFFAQSTFLKGYTGLEELPAGLMNKIEKLWHGAYRWSAVSNAHTAMKVAYWDTLDLITNSKYKTLGWADPQRTYKEPKEFLYPSEKQKMLYEMEWGAGATQYSYIAMGMPEIFRHKVLVPLTRLQSWWMNYFFRFHREAMTRALTGKTGYGARLPWSRRLAYLKYLILGGGILTALGYKRSFLLGVVPDTMSPAMQMAMGLYGYVTADSDYERKKSLKNIYYSWKAFVPGSLTFGDFYDVWTGKKPLVSLFFYKGGLPYPQEEKGKKFRPPTLRPK